MRRLYPSSYISYSAQPFASWVLLSAFSYFSLVGSCLVLGTTMYITDFFLCLIEIHLYSNMLCFVWVVC